MAAMDDFIAVGTQMKIERPGKACAITPCDIAEGPWAILRNGDFKQYNDLDSFRKDRPMISSIWDNGELVLGYGEFMENNKNLVPAAYSHDWWAADLIDALDSDQAVEEFCRIIGTERKDMPEGTPGLPINQSIDLDERFHIRRKWRDSLISLNPSWESAKEIAVRFSTSLVGAHNPWWLDLPIEWVPALLQAIESATVRDGNLHFIGGVKGWNADEMDELRPEKENTLDYASIPGPSIPVEKGIFSDSVPHSWVLRIHGLVKGSALMLGLAHHHDGDDLVITSGWQAMLDGLGFSIKGKAPMRIEDAEQVFKNRIEELRNAEIILAKERARKSELEQKRSSVKIAAETDLSLIHI